MKSAFVRVQSAAGASELAKEEEAKELIEDELEEIRFGLPENFPLDIRRCFIEKDEMS